jgi:hypothetical protein
VGQPRGASGAVPGYFGYPTAPEFIFAFFLVKDVRRRDFQTSLSQEEQILMKNARHTFPLRQTIYAIVGAALIGLALSGRHTAAGQQPGQIRYSGSQVPQLMDRQKEIALALSACPASVADKAAVYVLEKSGYVKVRESQNGFTAIVGHTLPNSMDPQCMNAEAARTHIPPILKLAEMRAQGKSSDEIKRTIAESRAKGIFPQPTGLGIDYMLSTENVVPNFKGGVSPYPPHVMLFVPGMTNSELGADVTLGADGNPHAPAFVVNEGTPQAIVIINAEAHAGPGVPTEHNHSGGSF